MKRLVFYLVTVPMVLFCCAQTTKQSLLSRYLKTGAYSYKQADVFSFSGNQAALARLKTFGAGAFTERRFMLQELNFFSAALALPTKSGNFGLPLYRYGNAMYNEMQAGLAYGRKLTEHIDVGVQFNYFTMQIAGYGNAAAINFEAGAIFHFTDQLHGGIHLYNPTSSKLQKGNGENLSSVYTAGLGFDATENFFVTIEIEKAEDLPVNVNAALQYKFAERFLARGGIATNTATYFLGVGFGIKSFRFDVTASMHPQLGVTPGLLFIYTKPAKE